jgi:DNA-binding protein HU-beta
MNKAELIQSVSSTMKTSKAAAEKAVAAVIGGIRQGLKKNKSVQIVGFGTFSVRMRKARQGRNPQTGATITIRASKTVAFKAGKALKESM